MSAEVTKVEWIDTGFYLQQSLLSGIEPQQKYEWTLVQSFAHYVAHYLNQRQQINNIGEKLIYKKILTYEIKDDEINPEAVKIITKLE